MSLLTYHTVPLTLFFGRARLTPVCDTCSGVSSRPVGKLRLAASTTGSGAAYMAALSERASPTRKRSNEVGR